MPKNTYIPILICFMLVSGGSSGAAPDDNASKSSKPATASGATVAVSDSSSHNEPSDRDAAGALIALVLMGIRAANLGSVATAVTIGGGLGSLSRYRLSQAIGSWSGNKAYGTMAVNLLGSFAFGLVVARVSRGQFLTGTAWLDFLTTGFLGGFTTFSAFANDAVQLSKTDGIATSAAYVLTSVGGALLALVAGGVVGSVVLPP